MPRQQKAKKGFMDGYKTYDTSEGYGNPASWKNAFKVRLGLDVAKETVGNDSPWGILGVSVDAPWNIIKSAYRKLVLYWHPDISTGDAEKFKKIQAAYEILEARFGK